MSALLSLRDAAVSLLAAAPAIADLVLAGREVPLPAEHDTALLVSIWRANGEAPFAGDTRVDWQVDLVVHAKARAAAGGNAEAAADALLAAAYARLAAAAAHANAGHWTEQPSIAFDIVEADRSIGAAELRLRIDIRTAAASLSAAA